MFVVRIFKIVVQVLASFEQQMFVGYKRLVASSTTRKLNLNDAPVEFWMIFEFGFTTVRFFVLAKKTIMKQMLYSCLPMPRLVLVALACMSLAFASCRGQNKSDEQADRTDPLTTSPLQPRSTPKAVTPLGIQDSKLDNAREPDFDIAMHISDVVRSVYQDKLGNLWIGAQNGLFRYDGTSLNHCDIKNAFGQGVTIKKIVEDRSGNIWCGATGGVVKYDGKSFTVFGEDDGLIDRDVWSIAVDSKGTIWIGTLQGVTCFDGEAFTPFAIPEAEPDRSRGITSAKIVHCIMEDSKGRMWFGTNGGAYIYDGKTLSNISEKDGLCNNAVHSFLEDQAGNIWFATTHNGICRYDGKVFTNFTADGMVDGKEVWCLHEDKAGNIWFSGKRFGVYRYDGIVFKKFDEKDGLDTPGIMCIFEDKERRLWLGGVNGLFRFDGKTFSRVTKNGPWE